MRTQSSSRYLPHSHSILSVQIIFSAFKGIVKWDRVAGGSYLPQAPSEPYVTVSRHTAQAFLRLSLAGPPGCFSNNEIYSYFIAYILEHLPGKYFSFSGSKENILLKDASGVYAVCYFNNLCDTHLQSFNRINLQMGAPAIAVICFPIFKDSPDSLAKKHLPGCACSHTRRTSAPFRAG